MCQPQLSKSRTEEAVHQSCAITYSGQAKQSPCDSYEQKHFCKCSCSTHWGFGPAKRKTEHVLRSRLNSCEGNLWSVLQMLDIIIQIDS